MTEINPEIIRLNNLAQRGNKPLVGAADETAPQVPRPLIDGEDD